ncbi:MAG TPA: hypothetical protein H9687_07615 [Firmicutes bacterium]|nr:hypothetical protein [Bacillota bacterium]
MRQQRLGIAILLFAILLTLAYGEQAVGDLSLRWHTIFVLLGVFGMVLAFLPVKRKGR